MSSPGSPTVSGPSPRSPTSRSPIPTVYREGAQRRSPPALRELDIQSPMYVVQVGRREHWHRRGVFHDDRYFYENLRGQDGWSRTLRLREGPQSRRRGARYRDACPGDWKAAINTPISWPLVGRPKEVRKYAPSVAGYIAPDSGREFLHRRKQPLRRQSGRLVNRSTSTWVARRSQTCSGE